MVSNHSRPSFRVNNPNQISWASNRSKISLTKNMTFNPSNRPRQSMRGICEQLYRKLLRPNRKLRLNSIVVNIKTVLILWRSIPDPILNWVSCWVRRGKSSIKMSVCSIKRKVWRDIFLNIIWVLVRRKAGLIILFWLMTITTIVCLYWKESKRRGGVHCVPVRWSIYRWPRER